MNPKKYLFVPFQCRVINYFIFFCLTLTQHEFGITPVDFHRLRWNNQENKNKMSVVFCLVYLYVSGIYSINSNIWWLEFCMDVKNFSFKDYCGFVNFYISESYFTKKKKKKKIFLVF